MMHALLVSWSCAHRRHFNSPRAEKDAAMVLLRIVNVVLQWSCLLQSKVRSEIRNRRNGEAVIFLFPQQRVHGDHDMTFLSVLFIASFVVLDQLTRSLAARKPESLCLFLNPYSPRISLNLSNAGQLAPVFFISSCFILG